MLHRQPGAPIRSNIVRNGSGRCSFSQLASAAIYMAIADAKDGFAAVKPNCFSGLDMYQLAGDLLLDQYPDRR